MIAKAVTGNLPAVTLHTNNGTIYYMEIDHV